MSPCVCACLPAQESEHLRLAAFEIYRTVLAKVTRRVLVFPLRHQVLSLVILLVLHLLDRNRGVAQVTGWGALGTRGRVGVRRVPRSGCFAAVRPLDRPAQGTC